MHVDDFLMAGTQDWLKVITSKIAAQFELGKVEEDFLYCGHQIICSLRSRPAAPLPWQRVVTS